MSSQTFKGIGSRRQGQRLGSLTLMGVASLMMANFLGGCIVTPAPEPAPAYTYQSPPPSYNQAPPPSYNQPPPPAYSQPPASAEVYVQVEPPPPPREVMPRPRRGFVWVPGHWEWRPVMGRYDWVPGYWERMRPGYRDYVAGHWERRPGGWIWIPGHWR